MSRKMLENAKRRYPQLNVRLSPEESGRFLAQAAKNGKGSRPVIWAAEVLMREVARLEKKEAKA